MPRHLFVVKELVKRDFRGRYAGSWLGFVWSFVQPLWLLLLFTFVFSEVLEIRLEGEVEDTFGLFLFAGLLPWMAVQEGVTRAATAITDNSELVKKLSFPAEVLVVAVALAALLHEAIALGAFLVVLAAIGKLAPGGLPLLLLALPLQLALTLGLGFLVAGAHVFFRDTAQILGLLFGAWFYLTPIVYPMSLVPERYVGLLRWNPLTPLVDLYRQALLSGELALPRGVLALAAVAAVLSFAGAWLFTRLKPAFPDQV
jgi:lipopolysaccharide transport system permease protein